jgi:molybdopterin synthase catalytic subunit
LVSNVSIVDGRLDLAAIRAAVTDPRAGAVVLFEGCARDHHGGRAVDELGYEAFGPMAERELAALREQAIERFGLCRCIIHHRTGTVPLTETAVAVATSSPHRKEAFAAALWIMDAIKERVPVWKRERYSEGGESWVEGEQRLP